MMTTPPPTVTAGTRRRIVLIDFDWQDTDLLPRLLQQPGVAVRLVAGQRSEDAGLRMAEVCGLPRTLDLADLTREIFDVALMSDRSPRHARVKSLLEALRTPCLSPGDFLASEEAKAAAPAAGATTNERAAKVPASPAPSSASETKGPVTSGKDFESVVESTLGGMERAVTTVRSQATKPARSLMNLRAFPSAEDRAALETALRQLVANTGAVGAELHAGRASGLSLVAQVGTHDPLLEGMVGLAYQFNKPQIIKGLSSPHEGKLWGAWPFRTIQHRAVLAASAIDPEGGVSPWEKMVDEMRERWDQQDREGVVRSFPLLAGQERTWLDRPEFRKRLELAVERNQFDGLAFSLHRLEFSEPEVAVDRMCEGLPQLLRGSDYMCRLPPRHVLLLTAVPADDYTHVRRRLLAAWEQAWRECGQAPPAPPIPDLRAEMAGPEDAEGFLASAEAWLAANPPSS